jgi:hypothetical protein
MGANVFDICDLRDDWPSRSQCWQGQRRQLRMHFRKNFSFFRIHSLKTAWLSKNVTLSESSDPFFRSVNQFKVQTRHWIKNDWTIALSYKASLTLTLTFYKELREQYVSVFFIFVDSFRSKREFQSCRF